VKQVRRTPALLLAMLMLFSLTLTSCGKKEEIADPDKVAVAIFDIVLKDDPGAIVELFGYNDEAEARKDMGIEGSVYDDLAEQMVDMFSGMGVTATTEDAQTFVDAFLTMFKNVTFSAKTKSADEKAGAAVVTCTISTFDPNGIENAMGQVMQEIMADEDLLAGDEAELYSAMLNKISAAIAELKPTDNTTDFDVDFVLEKHTINGKDRQVWMPKDVNGFGAAIGSNAMGA
jgi:hypothetical protein